MIRPSLLVIAILGLVACGRGDRGDAGGTAEVGAGTAGTTGGSPNAESCLEMVVSKNWSEASRICSIAYAEDPYNEKVKTALGAANAALAAEPAASSGSTSPGGEATGESAGEESGQEEAPN
jgi:hypothetical protein